MIKMIIVEFLKDISFRYDAHGVEGNNFNFKKGEVLKDADEGMLTFLCVNHAKTFGYDKTKKLYSTDIFVIKSGAYITKSGTDRPLVRAILPRNKEGKEKQVYIKTAETVKKAEENFPSKIEKVIDKFNKDSDIKFKKEWGLYLDYRIRDYLCTREVGGDTFFKTPEELITLVTSGEFDIKDFQMNNFKLRTLVNTLEDFAKKVGYEDEIDIEKVKSYYPNAFKQVTKEEKEENKEKRRKKFN